jgi:hypothetical protein
MYLPHDPGPSAADLQERPAVPPSDEGGDDRAGMTAAGAILIVLGFGLAVGLNVLLHLLAPAAGTHLGPYTVHHDLGVYAWTTLLLGLFTGTLGVAIAYVARASPRGPLVLPGYSY